jgi:mono/diheme cytochrome c family protein
MGTIVIAGGLASSMWPASDHSVQAMTGIGAADDAALVDVVLPDELSQNARIGERAYRITCAACHGANAAGQDGVAPRLIHKIYGPSHHGDEGFQRAATMVVRAHHWSFGDMPQLRMSHGAMSL